MDRKKPAQGAKKAYKPEPLIQPFKDVEKEASEALGIDPKTLHYDLERDKRESGRKKQ
jgi:hypothetical protein